MYLAHGLKPYKADGKFREFLAPLTLFSMGVGHYAPPHIGSSYDASNQFAVGTWNFQTFSNYVLGSGKCNLEWSTTQLLDMANLLLRGVWGSFRKNYK